MISLTLCRVQGEYMYIIHSDKILSIEVKQIQIEDFVNIHESTMHSLKIWKLFTIKYVMIKVYGHITCCCHFFVLL